MKEENNIGFGIRLPDYKWNMRLSKDGLNFNLRKAPFILWRWTQYLILGIKWIKIK